MVEKSWSDKTKLDVWNKGEIVSDHDETEYRKDQCGAWMQYSKHGDRNSSFGWEIDHIKPESAGGSDNLSNLRPLQWENNNAKSDGKLTCPVISNGKSNSRSK